MVVGRELRDEAEGDLHTTTTLTLIAGNLIPVY